MFCVFRNPEWCFSLSYILIFLTISTGVIHHYCNTDGTQFNWTVALGENAAIDQLDMAWERRELEDELSVKTNGKTVKGTSQQWATNKNERRVMKRIFPEEVERAIYSGALKKIPYGTRTFVRPICSKLSCLPEANRCLASHTDTAMEAMLQGLWIISYKVFYNQNCLSASLKPKAWPSSY